MKKMILLLILGTALAFTACKSDKKADAAAEAETEAGAEPKVSEVSAFKNATLEELTGDFADGNYPDKGFWKKFTVHAFGDNKVEVDFTSSPFGGKPGCAMNGTGVYRDGSLEIPLNPDSADPTYMTIRMLADGNILVGAKGGGQENPQDVLALYCQTNEAISIAGLYQRVKK